MDNLTILEIQAIDDRLSLEEQLIKKSKYKDKNLSNYRYNTLKEMLETEDNNE